MKRVQLTVIAIFGLSVLSLIGTGSARGAESGSSPLLEALKIRGGICLVVGAADTKRAMEFAGNSSLYVQVLQPDAKLNSKWGVELTDSANRENIGVRCAPFNADDYGTNLFNLIVVDRADAIGKAKLSDIARILVPNGVVAFKSAPADAANESKALSMAAQAAGGYTTFRKPVLPPPDWNVCDMLKWKAGPGGVGEQTEISVADGTLVYTDRLENEGDLKVMAGHRVVRDAYNGRTLSTEPLGGRKPDWYPLHVAAQLKPIKSSPAKPWEERGQGGGWRAVQENRPDGKLDLPYFGGHCFTPVQLGKFVLYHYNIWLNTETGERSYPNFLHPSCQFGQVPGNAMIYNFTSSKPGVIAGVTALAPADLVFTNEPGGKILQKFAPPAKAEPTTGSDWPMFRANPARGNACTAAPGDKPVKAWEIKLGLGTKPYGIMCGERTGLTQPVCAYGLVVVSDMDAERIVAVDAADGKMKWSFHVGCRVDFSPSLYNGLCIFGARNGWVYCLNARTGELVWRLLAAPRERFIGWQEKLGNLWPVRCDVLILDGIGYAAAGLGTTVQGGITVLAFKVETGETLWTQCYSEDQKFAERIFTADLFTRTFWQNRPILKMGPCTIDPATGKRSPDMQGGLAPNFDGYLDIGNSLSRTVADIAGRVMGDRRVNGRIVAFDDNLSVGHNMVGGAVTFESFGENKNQGKAMPLNFYAKKDQKEKDNLWKTPDIELVADDIVLTPQYVYCVGHYQRVAKTPELWVMSRDDGKVLNTIPVDGFPAFMGMSAAGNKLFVSTREGKLLCFGAK